MKLFEINESWIAAIDEQQALKHYMDIIGPEEEPEVIEILKETWKERTVKIEDEFDEQGNEEFIDISLEEYMLQFSEIDLPLEVASTEW